MDFYMILVSINDIAPYLNGKHSYYPRNNSQPWHVSCSTFNNKQLNTVSTNIFS